MRVIRSLGGLMVPFDNLKIFIEPLARCFALFRCGRRESEARHDDSVQDIPLEKLCSYGAEIGLKGIDLLEVSEWEVPRRYGLICSMGYAGGGDIPHALNRAKPNTLLFFLFFHNCDFAARAGTGCR